MELARGRLLGRGSTATVSLATSLSTGEIFALKSSELSRSLFLQREQSILSNLTSPYIVKYISSSLSHEDGTPMYNLCIQYAAGGTLTDLIRRRGGQLGEGEIATTARRILLGLQYLHGQGLAHCDIKPQNILVDEEDAAIIGDFGDSDGFSGTPAFMAPEVARGEEQWFAADIWAVGCTVIEMASGRTPWAEFADNPVSALYRIGFSDESPSVPCWLSEGAKDFVGKCLIKDPRERWSAEELLEHPFLHESEMKEVTSRSPSCVLDHGFWESLEGLDTPQNSTIQEVCFSNIHPSAAGDRMKRLMSGIPTTSTSSTTNMPLWSSDEEDDDDWITVRSNGDNEETEVESSDGPQDATLFLDSTSLNFDMEIGRPQESSVELDLESNFIISKRDGFVVGIEFHEINENHDSSFLKSLFWALQLQLCSCTSYNRLLTREKVNSVKNYKIQV
ncbi:Mitogen-activated protein kinase kinase kinase 18 [Linum perenne]